MAKEGRKGEVRAAEFSKAKSGTPIIMDVIYQTSVTPVFNVCTAYYSKAMALSCFSALSDLVTSTFDLMTSVCSISSS